MVAGSGGRLLRHTVKLRRLAGSGNPLHVIDAHRQGHPYQLRSAMEDRHCPRPATTTHGVGLTCGQHYRAFELECDEDEWLQAKKQLRHLCGLAKSAGNSAL